MPVCQTLRETCRLMARETTRYPVKTKPLSLYAVSHFSGFQNTKTVATSAMALGSWVSANSSCQPGRHRLRIYFLAKTSHSALPGNVATCEEVKNSYQFEGLQPFLEACPKKLEKRRLEGDGANVSRPLQPRRRLSLSMFGGLGIPDGGGSTGASPLDKDERLLVLCR